MLVRAPTGPPVPIRAQRAWLELGAVTNRPRRGLRRAGVDASGVPTERLEGAHEAGAPVVLYLHGGGYTVGSPSTHRALTVTLARAAGATVYAPGYRLAPEHPFPAALDDALTCYRWLLEGGTTPGRVAIAGDSAGGGLALSAAVAIRDRGLPAPAALALISPWADLTLSGESVRANVRDDVVLRPSWLRHCAPAYCGAVDPADPRCSPLFADLTGLPPTLIEGGTDDILLSDATRLAERAEAAGVEVELRLHDGLPHVFELYPAILPEARAAIGGIAAFLARHWEAASS